MTRFQKVLFALAAVVMLGWMGASTASAQVAFLASASGARPLRSEGITEATGVVVLSTTSVGTIPGANAFNVPAAGLAGGSQIVLDYGTLVNSTGDSQPPDVVAIPCSGTMTLIVNGAVTETINSGNTTGVATNGPIVKTCSGNAVILTFVANVAFTGSSSITISGVRVNANFRGPGASITASIAAISSNAGTQPITISTFGSLVLGTVQAAPSTTASVIATGGGQIVNIPLCTVATTVGAALGTLTATVVENFGQAFISATQEDNLGTAGDGKVNSTFKIRFRISGIPNGVRVAPAVGAATSATLTVANASVFTSTAEDSEADFDFNITGTSLTAGEQLVATFTVSIPNLANFDATKEATTSMTVTLKGPADPPASPVFSQSGAAIQFKNTVLRTLVCASYLLFPWVAYVADGSLDTGIAISNTTADPAVIGTTKQKGDVTLYFWTADGSTAPSPLKIATALDAGKSATFVASSLGKAYTGYIIAVCGFQGGHGLAAFLSPKVGVFGAAYLGISLPNPRLVFGGATEILGP